MNELMRMDCDACLGVFFVDEGGVEVIVRDGVAKYVSVCPVCGKECLSNYYDETIFPKILSDEQKYLIRALEEEIDEVYRSANSAMYGKFVGKYYKAGDPTRGRTSWWKVTGLNSDGQCVGLVVILWEYNEPSARWHVCDKSHDNDDELLYAKEIPEYEFTDVLCKAITEFLGK